MPKLLRSRIVAALLAAFVFSFTNISAQVDAKQETIVIDGKAPARPFPHFWEKMFGSGRAILSLRESYRNDMRETKQITGFEYVRFHAIFHDEVGVYSEDAQGNPVYNFSYVDQIYDGLLANGVKPFVEISFMPKQLAAQQILHPFWYKQNVAPPKDWQKWDGLIAAFIKHLVDRYGVEEVANWYFEVWNEPNIDFWAGEPKQSTYWQLYEHTARTVKKVNSRLRIGGPATAQAAWVRCFHQILHGQQYSFGFCFQPRLRKRRGQRCVQHRRKYSPRSNGLPVSKESPRPNQSFSQARSSFDLERVQRKLQK